MSFSESLLTLLALLLVSGFFSVSEIALAASSRLRLTQLAEKGDPKAIRVLRIHEQPGQFFTVVQIGLNSVAILGGIVGEGNLSPYLSNLLLGIVDTDTAQTVGFFWAPLYSSRLCSLFLLTCSRDVWVWSTQKSWPYGASRPCCF